MSAWNSAVVDPNNNSSGSSGMSNNDLALIQLIYGAWARHQQNNPKFHQEPMSPEQRAIWNIYYQSLTDPAYKDNAHLVNNVANNVVRAGPPKWTSPKTFSGDVGYSGNSPFDINALIPPPGGGTTPPPAPPPPDGSVGGGLPGGGSGPQTHLPDIPPPGGSSVPPPSSSPPGGSGWAPSSIQEIIQRYGRAAAEGVLALITMNPGMGIKAAWDAYKAWSAGGGEPDKTLPNPSNPKLPDTTPGDPYGGLGQSNDPWFNMFPDNGTSVNYTPNPGLGNYVNHSIVDPGNSFLTGGSQEGSDWGNLTNRTQFNTPRGGRGVQAV